MFSRIESNRRSNHSIFLTANYGSPFNDTAEHISGLGLARIDFERCAVAGEVIYSVEGDLTPTSQQDEEARIATLAHAIKKLDNPEEAAEFMRCLNAICEGGDARYRQVVASYYYGEIAERGAGPVLKEMALIAMHLASLIRNNAELNAQIASETALGRVGLPDDIGAAVSSLLADDNRWINAQRIEISGGMMIQVITRTQLPEKALPPEFFRNALMSFSGGSPNRRRYSRLN